MVKGYISMERAKQEQEEGLPWMKKAWILRECWSNLEEK